MPIENNFLRVNLTFLNGLEEIQTMPAIASPLGNERIHGGIVKGPQQLEDFLTEIGIDSYLEMSGDLNPRCGPPTFAATLHDRTPALIVSSLKTIFEREHAIQLKILGGENLSASETELKPPISITVCAQSLTSSEGVARISEWFDSHSS